MPETPREYYILSYLTPFLDLNGVQEVASSNLAAPIELTAVAVMS